MNVPGTTCEEPVAVVSDLHLSWFGRWAARLERLRPLWSGVRTIVFNGDTVNWPASADEPRSRQMLAHLRRLCEEDEVRTIFLAGNCDYDIVDRGHLTLAGGRILVTHGEVIFPSICPWRRQAAGMRRERDLALQKMPPQRRASLEGQLASVRQALTVLQGGIQGPVSPVRGLLQVLAVTSQPGRLWRMLRAWRQTPVLAARFLKLYWPQAGVIIIGHTHRPGLWQLNDRIIVNTGSLEWPGRALVARVEAERVRVQKIARRGGEYRPGRTVADFSVG
jgi:predicted phosphodiesterase